MKNLVKLTLLFGVVILITVNVFSSRIFSSKDLELQFIETILAQSECPDDERNVPEACVIPCPGGGSAGGEMVYCMTGLIDCTPKDCDAKCGIEV